MAIKGLSIPVCGKYTNTEGRITYSEPTMADKAIEYSVSWSTGDDNPLYANNKISENEKGTFRSGELTLGTADMPQELSKLLLGTKTKEVTFGPTGKQITAQEQTFDDEQKAPYFGFGIIEMHQIDDVDTYRAIFFPKVYFRIPEEAATTKGETIEWQTRSISGTIQRSDAVSEDGRHPWMQDAWFESESDAVNYLLWKCGKTDWDSVEEG